MGRFLFVIGGMEGVGVDGLERMVVLGRFDGYAVVFEVGLGGVFV